MIGSKSDLHVHTFIDKEPLLFHAGNFILMAYYQNPVDQWTRTGKRHVSENLCPHLGPRLRWDGPLGLFLPGLFPLGLFPLDLQKSTRVIHPSRPTREHCRCLFVCLSLWPISLAPSTLMSRNVLVSLQPILHIFHVIRPVPAFDSVHIKKIK